jgi:hypothetical protein
MKTFSFFFTLALLLFSCSSPENKAKKAIKEELRLTLHDFKSYEPVQFGKLEIASSNYIDLPETNIYLSKSDAFLTSSKEYSDKAEIYDSDYSRDKYWEYTKISNQFLDSAKLYINKVDSIKLHFVSKEIGWQMTHSFRAKSLGGNLGIHRYLFILDKDLSKVIKSVDQSAE